MHYSPQQTPITNVSMSDFRHSKIIPIVQKRLLQEDFLSFFAVRRIMKNIIHSKSDINNNSSFCDGIYIGFNKTGNYVIQCSLLLRYIIVVIIT